MTVLAWAVVVCTAFQLLPGTAYRHRHELRDYNWEGPHVYVNLAGSIAGIALAVWVLA